MQDLKSRLHIRHLRLLKAIAERGQLSLAAEQLAITQPAASRSLSEIERIVGDPLFERRPNGMEPTSIGCILIRHAHALLGQFDRVVEEVESFQIGRSGNVRIGAVTGSAVRIAVPAIQKLKAETLTVSISVDVAPSVELLDGISKGDYDIVLCRPSADSLSPELSIQKGRIETLRVVTRSGHPLLKNTRVNFLDLQNYTWIIQRAGMPIRDAMVQAYASRDLTPPTDTVDTASLLMALSYLETSDAVAAMTEEVAELVASQGERWRILPLNEQVIMSPYSLIARQPSLANPLCARLHDLLRSELIPG